MKTFVHRWTDVSQEPLTLAAIRSLHQPESHFRISPSAMPAGVKFTGLNSIAGRIYVLRGRCSMTVGDWRADLRSGTFADFPAGSFTFEVFGTNEIEVVKVWLIPESYQLAESADTA